MVKLTENEKNALIAWIDTEEDFDVLSFKRIHVYGAIPRHLVRRTVRALARKGITHFVRGCMTEDGDMAGSGYSLTKEGRELLNSTFAEAEWDSRVIDVDKLTPGEAKALAEMDAAE